MYIYNNFFNKNKYFSDKAAKKDAEEEGRSSTVSLKIKKKASGISSESVKIQRASKWYGLLIFLPSIF